MKLSKFKDNDQYVHVQIRTDRRKKKTNRRTPFREKLRKFELKRLADYLTREKGPPARGICHGVRTGEEVLVLRDLFPDCDVMGTDLIYDDPGLVTNMDFHKRVDEWVGSFDFLYSNALDHSHSPGGCMKTWMEQLKPNGLAFIQWTRFHMGTRGGDCFGALLHEYIILMGQVGTVKDLIYCGHSVMTLIVVSPRVRRGTGVDLLKGT